MRAGLVGLGSIGRRHLGNLLSLGCVVRGMDISEAARERAKSEYPTAQISDRLDFTDLDAIVIATPWDRHLEWVEEAIRRRLPFFVEKPLGSLEQLPRWREIAAMDLPVNQVGYMLRFNHQVFWLRDSVREPVYVDVAVQWDGSRYADGLLESSHEVDLLAFLAREPVAPSKLIQSCEGRVDVALGPHRITMDWRPGQAYRRQWQVESRTRSAWFMACSPDDLGVEMYFDELAHFLLCVREGLATNVPLADGLKVLEVVQQVEQMTRPPA